MLSAGTADLVTALAIVAGCAAAINYARKKNYR